MFAHLSFTDMDVKPRDHSLGRIVDFIQNGSGSKFGQQNGALFCSIQVDQASMAMKERFGQYQEVLEAGSHCVPWFFGSQIRGNLPLRVQKLDVRCETKTKDNVFVTMVASVQYCALVEKASDALYKLSGQVSLR